MTAYDQKHLINSISFYRSGDIPSHEIDQAIAWLKSIQNDCDYKISSLERIKAERQRLKDYRKNINTLAAQFCTDEMLALTTVDRILHIRTNMSCSHEKAAKLEKIVHRWAQNQMKRKMYSSIAKDLDDGRSVSEIAKKNDLSRSQIYNIKKKLNPVMVK